MFCSLVQIVHLKRFQFVNNRWIKSQKIVRFPRDNFDPSAFLTPRDVNHSLQGWRGGFGEEFSEKEHVTNSGDPPSTPTSLNINDIKGQLSSITGNKGLRSLFRLNWIPWCGLQGWKWKQLQTFARQFVFNLSKVTKYIFRGNFIGDFFKYILIKSQQHAM